MKACTKIVTEGIKNSKGRRHWLKNKIKELESIDNPSILEKYELCLSYSTLFHIPFSNEPNIIREYCKVCSFKPKDIDVFHELHKEQ